MIIDKHELVIRKISISIWYCGEKSVILNSKAVAFVGTLPSSNRLNIVLSWLQFGYNQNCTSITH